jgi:hypothetical protein
MSDTRGRLSPAKRLYSVKEVRTSDEAAYLTGAAPSVHNN